MARIWSSCQRLIKTLFKWQRCHNLQGTIVEIMACHEMRFIFFDVFQVVSFWKGDWSFDSTTNLSQTSEATTKLCQKALLYRRCRWVCWHDQFLPWPWYDYQASQYSCSEGSVADWSIEAADNHSTLWQNGMKNNFNVRNLSVLP